VAASEKRDFCDSACGCAVCERRVVGKAEYLVDKPNARFVVTSLPIEEVAA
jgi:hypothetical protein